MKVLLIDDHPLILAALQAVIRGLGDDVTVVGVSTEREARAALKSDPDHDLVLLDLHLGDGDGFELLAELRGLYPALPIVVVSASDRASDVIRAIDTGAMGFVPKRASNDGASSKVPHAGDALCASRHRAPSISAELGMKYGKVMTHRFTQRLSTARVP